MLVITRKVNESFLVGDNVKITIVKTDRGNVRIGIEAPRDVPVVRTEIAGRKPDKPGQIKMFDGE